MCIQRIADCLLIPWNLGCQKQSRYSKGYFGYCCEKIQQIFFGILAIILFPCTILGLCLSRTKKIESKPAPKPKNTVIEFKNQIQKCADFKLPNWFILEMMKDTAVFKESEKRTFVVERINQLKDILQSRQSPARFMQKRIHNDLGTSMHKAIPRLVPELQQLIAKHPHKRKFCSEVCRFTSRIAHCKSKIVEISNIQALHALKSELHTAVGKELTQTLLNDWEFIGIDIRDNRALLTEERKNKIIEKAKEANHNQRKLEQILEQLKYDLQRDLPAVEETIFQKYKELPKLLAVLPPSNLERFHKVISWGYIHQQIRHPSHSPQEKYERRIVQILGYDLKKYDDKEQINQILNTLLKELLNQNDLNIVHDYCASNIKKEIEELAKTVRLEAAGILKKEIHSFATVIKCYEEAFENYKQQVHTMDFEPFQRVEKLSLESSKKWLKRGLQGYYLQLFQKNIRQFLDQSKYEIRSWFNKDDFASIFKNFWNAKMETITLDQHHATLANAFEKKLQWFEKYHRYFVYEFCQGEHDEQEILGSGLCFAICVRLCKNILNLPEGTLEQLMVTSVHPIDRVLQAAYSLHHKKVRPLELPPKILTKHGLKQRPLFIASGHTGKVAAITAQIGCLNRSKGSMILLSGGHAAAMVLNHQRKEYYFFDPIFGKLQFNQEEEENDEDVIARMALCYVELCAWAYEDAPMCALQLLPMSSREKPTPIYWESVPHYY